MRTQSGSCARLVVVRLDTGDDILQSLRAAAAENGIRNGVILSGAGSLNRYHVHVVGNTQLPVKDIFIRGEGPYDILTLTGAVLDGRVHAHITFADTDRAVGGHLEEGSTILTFGLVTIADAPELDLAGWDAVGKVG